MNEKVMQHNPNERVEKFVTEMMQFYNDLTAEDQVIVFNLFKTHAVQHRMGMINDCKSHLEATEYRLKMLHGGLEQLKSEMRDDVLMQVKSNH